jgi:large subunit ribosomal protein L18Ae
MYKEYRDLTRSGAVASCYQDMASRHSARFRSIQVIRVAEVKKADVRRSYITQLLDNNIKFPLPHRLLRAPSRRFRSTFIGKRPSTHF